MKLKIVSNGDPLETHVLNAETGERLEGVTSIAIDVDTSGSRACIQLAGYELELVGDFEKKNAPGLPSASGSASP